MNQFKMVLSNEKNMFFFGWAKKTALTLVASKKLEWTKKEQCSGSKKVDFQGWSLGLVVVKSLQFESNLYLQNFKSRSNNQEFLNVGAFEEKSLYAL